jgi:hypothetical protein
VTVPAYLIRHRGGQRGDILINEDDLTLDLADGWAVFTSAGIPALAIPADQVAYIERIDHEDMGNMDDTPAPGR